MLILNLFGKRLKVVVKIMAHTLKNIKIIFLVVLLTKLFVLIINSVQKGVLYRGKNAVYRFIKAILEEYDYCKKNDKKAF